MKKFNRLFKENITEVKILGEWFRIKEINDTRINIKIEGLCGSFQRGHVEKFRNKRD